MGTRSGPRPRASAWTSVSRPCTRCSRRSRRRRSCVVTARASAPSLDRAVGRVGSRAHVRCRHRRCPRRTSSRSYAPTTIVVVLRRLRIENLVLIRDADLELAPGLNAVTGETGAGKTIFAQAIGLLLGARADAGIVGAAGDEAYVEAELDLPDGMLEADDLATLAELRPADEPGLVLARRVFADGRTRAYAWGRAVTRDDVAAAAERLIAMSGQFEQRRLARASYRIDILDAACEPAHQ